MGGPKVGGPSGPKGQSWFGNQADKDNQKSRAVAKSITPDRPYAPKDKVVGQAPDQQLANQNNKGGAGISSVSITTSSSGRPLDPSPDVETQAFEPVRQFVNNEMRNQLALALGIDVGRIKFSFEADGSIKVPQWAQDIEELKRRVELWTLSLKLSVQKDEFGKFLGLGDGEIYIGFGEKKTLKIGLGGVHNYGAKFGWGKYRGGVDGKGDQHGAIGFVSTDSPPLIEISAALKLNPNETDPKEQKTVILSIGIFSNHSTNNVFGKDEERARAPGGGTLGTHVMGSITLLLDGELGQKKPYGPQDITQAFNQASISFFSSFGTFRGIEQVGNLLKTIIGGSSPEQAKFFTEVGVAGDVVRTIAVIFPAELAVFQDLKEASKAGKEDKDKKWVFPVLLGANTAAGVAFLVTGLVTNSADSNAIAAMGAARLPTVMLAGVDHVLEPGTVPSFVVHGLEVLLGAGGILEARLIGGQGARGAINGIWNNPYYPFARGFDVYKPVKDPKTGQETLVLNPRYNGIDPATQKGTPASQYNPKLASPVWSAVVTGSSALAIFAGLVGFIGDVKAVRAAEKPKEDKKKGPKVTSVRPNVGPGQVGATISGTF